MKKRSLYGLWAVCWLLAACGALLIAAGPIAGLRLKELTLSKPGIMWLSSIYLWGFAAIYLCALIRFVRVVKNIALDRSFITENARAMRAISTLAFLAGAWIAAGAALIPLTDLPVPAPYCVCGAILAVGCVVVGLLARALSKLTARAAEIKAENDLTV